MPCCCSVCAQVIPFIFECTEYSGQVKGIRPQDSFVFVGYFYGICDSSVLVILLVIFYFGQPAKSLPIGKMLLAFVVHCQEAIVFQHILNITLAEVHHLVYLVILLLIQRNT